MNFDAFHNVERYSDGAVNAGSYLTSPLRSACGIRSMLPFICVDAWILSELYVALNAVKYCRRRSFDFVVLE